MNSIGCNRISKESVIWICDFCQRQGGMTIHIDHCPDCHHRRCEHCTLEVITFRHHETSKKRAQTCKEKKINQSLGYQSMVNTLKPLNTSPIPNTLDGDRGLQLKTAYLAQTEISEAPRHVSDTQVPALSSLRPQRADEIQLNNISPPRSPPALSPCSRATTPNNFCDTPSYIESPYASTDTDSDNAEQDGESDKLMWDRTAIVLESHFLQVFRYDLEMATRLIPRIRKTFQDAMVALADSGRREVPNQNKTNPTGNHRGHLTTSSTPTSKSSGASSHRSKRARGSDDEGEQDNSDKSKRSRSKVDASPSTENQAPRFACPFHKKEPRKYHRGTNLRFGPCSSPGWTELRHLKDHLKNVHKPSQCDRCYEIFKDIHILTQHRRAGQCAERSDIHKEGIDDSQWFLIDSLIRTRRGLSPDERGQHDIDKWYEMWRIIFGDFQAPRNPYVNDTTHVEVVAPALDIESRMAEYDNLIESEIRRGVIQRDNQVVEYRRVTRAFLEATLATPGLRERIEPPATRPEEPPEQHTGLSDEVGINVSTFWQHVEGVENLDFLAQDFYHNLSDQRQTPEGNLVFTASDSEFPFSDTLPNPDVLRSPSMPPGMFEHDSSILATEENLLDSQPNPVPDLQNILTLPFNPRQIHSLDSSFSTTNSSDSPVPATDGPSTVEYQLSTNDAQHGETLAEIFSIQPAVGSNQGKKHKYARKAGVQTLDGGDEYVSP